jgi:hypothetical protein
MATRTLRKDALGGEDAELHVVIIKADMRSLWPLEDNSHGLIDIRCRLETMMDLFRRNGRI